MTKKMFVGIYEIKFNQSTQRFEAFYKTEVVDSDTIGANLYFRLQQKIEKEKVNQQSIIQLRAPLNAVKFGEPWNQAKLKSNHELWLQPNPDISEEYRHGFVYDLESVPVGIIDLKDMGEDDGYQDAYGSAYLWEIVAVRDENGVYHLFKPTK